MGHIHEKIIIKRMTFENTTSLKQAKFLLRFTSIIQIYSNLANTSLNFT